MRAASSRKGKKIGNRKARVAALVKVREALARKRLAQRRASMRRLKRTARAAISVATTTASGGGQWAVPLSVSVQEDTTKPEPRPVGMCLPSTGAFRLRLGDRITLTRDLSGDLSLSFPSDLFVNLEA